MLSTGSLRHTRLGSILLEKDQILPTDLERALEIQRASAMKLGDVLVRFKMLTREQIDECLRRQIEEEISEIFLWNKADFSFEPGQPRGEFFDPAGDGKAFDLNVSHLLIEAARNVDEWSELLVHVQNAKSKFIYGNHYPILPDTSPFGIPLAKVARLPFIADEPMTLEEIATRLDLDLNSTAKLIAYLVKHSRVREIPQQESSPTQVTETSSESRVEKWETRHQYGETTKGAPRETPDNTVPGAGPRDHEISRLIELSDRAREIGDDRTAAEILGAALQLAPDNHALRQKTIKAYINQWKFAEAAKLLVEGCQLKHAVAC